MKKKIFTLIFVSQMFLSFAQTDTIFSNNEKIACTVKEITPEAVKFAYPGEDLINSIYKNSVQKIIFKSGRIQEFAEATSFKKVSSVDDYENVSISQIESEVKGLFKVGDVSSKAVGTTEFSNQERVKERAYRKLKLQAAMMGANIIYIVNQRTEGNKWGGKYQSSSSAETNLTGVAYTNLLPSFAEFKKLISDKKNFKTVLETNLWSSASDITQKDVNGRFVIYDITYENGLIMLNVTLEQDGWDIDNLKCRVVSFTTEYFNVFYEDKSTVYNVKVKL